MRKIWKKQEWCHYPKPLWNLISNLQAGFLPFLLLQVRWLRGICIASSCGTPGVEFNGHYGERGRGSPHSLFPLREHYPNKRAGKVLKCRQIMTREQEPGIKNSWSWNIKTFLLHHVKAAGKCKQMSPTERCLRGPRQGRATAQAGDRAAVGSCRSRDVRL